MRRSLLVIILAALLVAPLSAFAQIGDNNSGAEGPMYAGIASGELPPGNAMSLTPAQARAAIEDALRKKYAGEWAQCALLICAKAQISPATQIKVLTSGFEAFVHYEWTAGVPKSSHDTNQKVTFRTARDWVKAFSMPMMRTPKPLYVITFVHASKRDGPLYMMTLGWNDQATAQRFADAFNRLVYYAHNEGPNSKENLQRFAAVAKAWRENPQKPPLPAEVDRKRVLAEARIKEKDFGGAIALYEEALDIFPTWPEAWFNTALIYGELGDYASAAGSMRHYLELMPNAPDSAAAREKVIVWEDKAAR